MSKQSCSWLNRCLLLFCVHIWIFQQPWPWSDAKNLIWYNTCTQRPRPIQTWRQIHWLQYPMASVWTPLHNCIQAIFCRPRYGSWFVFVWAHRQGPVVLTFTSEFSIAFQWWYTRTLSKVSLWTTNGVFMTNIWYVTGVLLWMWNRNIHWYCEKIQWVQ